MDTNLHALVKTMAAQAKGRTEADLQSDVKALLVSGALNLDDTDIDVIGLEAQVGDGTQRRIDVEAGFAIIEVKKKLTAKVLDEAVEQLAGYVATRTAQTGGRYVGILTDGASWHLYRLTGTAPAQLVQVSQHRVDPVEPEVDRLVLWLETVLATGERIPAIPAEVTGRLGASSAGFDLDLAELTDLYAQVAKDPEVALKRELWAKSLATALGTQFSDDDALFVGHTYLVTVAELVAHAAIGYDLTDPSLDPVELLDGNLFRKTGIRGVVEADFFDWVVDGSDGAGADEGKAFVRALARRVARFDWSSVDHDVLKALYESVIAPETRHALGEYYTPDWLAGCIVADAVNAPLEQRVLDPSCGSGTFLFQTIRHLKRAAAEQGWGGGDTLDHIVRHVSGVDLHPVAVTLARVTYLLALGKDLYAQRSTRGFSVPVFLGDSLQWDRPDVDTLWGAEGLTVPTADGHELFAQELRFPEETLADPESFDLLVAEMATKATDRKRGSAAPKLSGQFFTRHGVSASSRNTIAATFKIMCELHDHHRDHIWGYYVRNLARPLWLARQRNTDVLVGNPPWVAYRYMSPRMQTVFKARGDALGVRPKGKLATHADLAAFFVVTAVDAYLVDGGRFGFVMPRGALGGPHYREFRTGAFPTGGPRNVTYSTPWDLAAIRPHLFPVPACVIFGAKTPAAGALPGTASAWAGKIPAGTSPEAASQAATRTDVAIVNADAGPLSPYHDTVRQGATLVPRSLLLVVDDDPGPLGAPPGQRAVRSRRGGDKQPWKNLPDLTGNIETEFLRRCYLGASIAPHRVLDHETAVIGWDGHKLLEGNDDAIDAHPGLAAWWRSAEKRWDTAGEAKMTLLERADYQSTLSNQFPIAARRVVYTTSGTYLAAAIIEDDQAVIDHKLYWVAVATRAEARYLTAILNSDALLVHVAPLQSTGQFGTRDFHRYPFFPPVPTYDPTSDLHTAIAASAETSETVAASVEATGGFQQTRKTIRQHLAAEGTSDSVDALVDELIATS